MYIYPIYTKTFKKIGKNSKIQETLKCTGAVHSIVGTIYVGMYCVCDLHLKAKLRRVAYPIQLDAGERWLPSPASNTEK